MKKIVKLSLILLVMVFIMGNVYAALSCNVNMKVSKTQLNKNEQFTVDIDLSNIQSDRGIISLGGTLEYDKDSLELVKMEGKNGWETPTEGATYNQSNGKIAITRSGLGKDDETVFTATFKVKEASKKNLVITFKNITVADGTAPAKISLTSKNITITDGTSNPVPNPGEDDNTGNNNNNNNNQNTTGNKTNTNTGKNTSTNTLNKNSINSSSLPKAGNTTAVIFIVIISLAIIVAGAFFIKMKILNDKMRH